MEGARSTLSQSGPWRFNPEARRWGKGRIEKNNATNNGNAQACMDPLLLGPGT